MTIFLVFLCVIGWLLALGAIGILLILAVAFSIQEARMNELKSDLEVMVRRANLFGPKDRQEDI
jgi:hypothetical protein